MKKYYSIIILVLACMIIIMLTRTYSNSKAYKKPDINSNSNTISYTYPGEFEKQQAIWMQWPEGEYSTASQPIYPVFINIIKYLAPYIRINLISQSEEEIAQIKDLLKSNGYSGKNVYYYTIEHLSIWARDVGPVFVKDNQNRLNVVNFGFNNYGRGASQYYIDIESQVDKKTAELLKLPVINTNLVSEGGGIESNGRGTIMITESVALNRNPGLTKNQIEDEYKRVLGAKKVIWLKQGLAEDDLITKGHINEIARFADPNTVLLAQVLPEDKDTNSYSQSSYWRLEENYNILLKSTDQDGKPFRIIRIPMPPTLYGEVDDTGKIPVRSYLNYAITNGAVIMQTYWKPGRSDKLKNTEDQVKDIFQSVFPDRAIIGINAESVNLWGGGIHCITQHMPI